MKFKIKNPLFAAMLALGTGCAVPLSDEPTVPARAVNLSRLENSVGGEDPIEGANRVMFSVNDFCMDYVVDPIGRVYCTILPRPVIDAIDNVCVNLEFPARAVSCLLSAQWSEAGDESIRFLANTTIGVAGIFDVAGPWWGYYNTGSDFGQAFAAWGMAPGCTLTLPFCRSVNVRDTAGLIFDNAFDGKTYIPFAGYATTVNRMVVAHRSYISVVEGSADRYKSYRQLMLVYRELQLRKYIYRARKAMFAAKKSGTVPPDNTPAEVPPPRPDGLAGEWLPVTGFSGETPHQQSLRLLRFKPQVDNDRWYYPLSLFNGDFARSGSVRRLALYPDRDKAKYCFWKQPKPADGVPPRREQLVLVLPGIGGSFKGGTILALCELFYRAGYDVASFDSAFSWSFMLSCGDRTRLPGFLPEDAAAVRLLLTAALADLRGRGEVKSPRIVLAGYSMGAMHALKIASAGDGGADLPLDRVVAINPPVDLGYALERADSFARGGGGWSPREAVNRIVNLSGRQLIAGALTLPPYGKNSPPAGMYRFEAEPEEASCAVGLYLNSSLRDVLLTAHRERPLNGITAPYRTLNRNRLYLELDAVSFGRYAEELLPAEYPGIARDELFAASNLRSLEKTLRDDRRIRIVHSWNDPLLSPDDVKFLDSTLTGRICWVSGGGHLGELCVEAVQQKIISLAAAEKSASPSTGASREGADKR